MLFLFIFLFKFISCERYYILKNVKDYFEIELFIGFPYQRVSLRINQCLPYNFIPFSQYDEKVSITKRFSNPSNHQIELNSKIFNVTNCTDNLIFNKNQSEKFITATFYIINNYTFHESGLSLAHRFLQKSFSIVHIMKENNIIEKLNYAILPLSKTENKIIFGDKSLNETQANCDTDEDSVSWSCLIVKVGFEKYPKYFFYKNKVSFQYNQKSSFVSCDFLEYFLNMLEFFGRCSYIKKSKYNQKFIYCDDLYDIKEVPNIKFIFQNFLLNVRVQDFFDCDFDGYQCTSNIKCLISPETGEGINNKNWIFGGNFLRLYNIKFDYTSSKVSFYEYKNNKIENLKNTNNREKKIQLKIILLNIIILITSIIIISFRKKIFYFYIG